MGGERAWVRTLSQVETFGAIYEFLEKRGDAPKIDGDGLIGLRAAYDEDGRPIYVFWSERKRPQKAKRPFRWPWQPDPPPSPGGGGTP